MCRRCGMIESEAKTMLEAYMECDRRKNDVSYEKQCHKDCDNCKLCYTQGTVGEHREAMNMAIKALEKQIPKKPHKNFEKFSGVWCSCGKYLGKGYFVDKPSYCPDCGQAFDWSDTD